MPERESDFGSDDLGRVQGKISRRDFLKAIGAIAGSIILAACTSVFKTPSSPMSIPSLTLTSTPSLTETLASTATITPLPTETHKPKPSETPIPDFPHKIVDGKIVFDWAADVSKFLDLTDKGSKTLTKEMIFTWLNSTSSYGLLSPMPNSDSVCPISWVRHKGIDIQGNILSRSLIFRTSEQCTKENAPVRVLQLARGYINFQDQDNWYSLPVQIFAFQIYTPDHPNGKLIPFILQEGSRPPTSFASPERYLAPFFGFTDPTLSENGYSPQGVARILRSIGLYDQYKVDKAMQEWEEHGYPTDAVDGLVFVGDSGTLNQFKTP